MTSGKYYYHLYLGSFVFLSNLKKKEKDLKQKCKEQLLFPLGNPPTGSNKIPSSTVHGDNVEPDSHPPPISLAKDVKLWGGVIGGSSILAVVMIIAAVIKRKRSKKQGKRDTRQRQPLMSSVEPGKF